MEPGTVALVNNDGIRKLIRTSIIIVIVDESVYTQL